MGLVSETVDMVIVPNDVALIQIVQRRIWRVMSRFVWVAVAECAHYILIIGSSECRRNSAIFIEG